MTEDCRKLSQAGRAGLGSPILAAPMQPGPFRICPGCLGWFALVQIESLPNALVGKVVRCRCRKCGRETDFAAEHPPGTV